MNEKPFHSDKTPVRSLQHPRAEGGCGYNNNHYSLRGQLYGSGLRGDTSSAGPVTYHIFGASRERYTGG